MNKKVSTIFAMAALMGGVFSGSAYAQGLSTSTVTSIAEGDVIMLQQSSGEMLGVIKNNDGSRTTKVDVLSDIVKEEALNYTWNVKKVAVDENQTNNHLYVFVNAVTGDSLSFSNSDDTKLFFPQKVGTKMQYAKNNVYSFTFGNPAADYSIPAKIYAASSLSTTPKVLTLAATPAESVSLQAETPAAPTFAFVKLDNIKVTGAELNLLYNGKGFNLGAEKVSGISAAVEDNLFGEDSPVWAITVPSSGKVINTLDDGTQLLVPGGTYIFSDPVFNGGLGASAVTNADQINWLASTLIAVSPTKVGESTDANRGEGEGFKLVEVKGSDFIFENPSSQPQGDDISIYNACFTIMSDHSANSGYPYSVELKKFYYQKSAKYATTDNQTELNSKIYLGVTSYDNSRQNVATKNGDTPAHSFNLSSSSVVDGRTLLKETPTAAVYTIKFVEGVKAKNDLLQKYLTVGADANGDFQWEAKGAAIAKTEYPIFQFVITSARKEAGNDKYVWVTFTNRETGKNFTTKLFPEGENRYSMSETLYDVVPYTVNTQSANTYEVDDLDEVDVDADVIIELNPVTVDRYAGFLNADNESIRTLAFARDQYDTSNKLYTIVQEHEGLRNPDGTPKMEIGPTSISNIDPFTNELSDAAQWQLVKSESPVSLTRAVVYNNTATESVDDVPNGDVLYAYVYALRYVENGSETKLFLNSNSTSNSPNFLIYKTEDEIEEMTSKLTGSAHYDVSFIVKENVDGSVSLIHREDAFHNTGNSAEDRYVAASGAAKDVEVVLSTSGTGYMYDYDSELVYASLSQTNEIKTYLDPQKVEISWPAHEGHVNLMSELGNYINMNEDRDAIVVDESDADTYYLYVTDKDAVVPSFYITKGIGATDGERLYMFNPTDSAAYYVADGTYNKKYQWNEEATKVTFKPGIINETRDTLTLTVKGEADKKVAMKADDNDRNIWGGLNRFKWQIIEAEDAEGMYYIRQPKADNINDPGVEGIYLSNLNDKLTWSGKTKALLFQIENAAAPTANEGVSATEVKVIATDGAINIKNAAGKNVVISTILGQIVANEVLTSDNATISVPAGIAIVSVDGEEAVKVSVR